MNQYRCETCKFLTKEPVDWGFDPYCHISVPIKLDNWEWVRRWGCASHSDFQSERVSVVQDEDGYIEKRPIQSEREKVLKDLHNWFEKYCEGNEEADLWMAFIHAERSLRQKAGE